jgi:hypothetical protein
MTYARRVDEQKTYGQLVSLSYCLPPGPRTTAAVTLAL